MGFVSVKKEEASIKKVNRRIVMDVITAYQTHINSFVNITPRDLKYIMELMESPKRLFPQRR